MVLYIEAVLHLWVSIVNRLALWLVVLYIEAVLNLWVSIVNRLVLWLVVLYIEAVLHLWVSIWIQDVRSRTLLALISHFDDKSEIQSLIFLEIKIKSINWFLERIPHYKIPWPNYNGFDLSSCSTNIIMKNIKSYFLFQWFLLHSGNYIHCISTFLFFNDSISFQFADSEGVVISTFESFTTKNLILH